jgi:PTS system mannose-specific IID component
MKRPRASLYLACFFRSYMVGAAYNPHGLQNIGFLYAIEPVLAALYGPGEALREARLRYALQFNCHPFFTPLFLGVLLHMETAIAEKRFEPTLLVNLKDTTANTLSAIGDSFFSGSLLCAWALSSACLILAGMQAEALGLTVLAFFFLQILKLASFVVGFRKGLSVLLFIRRLDLINLGDHCKNVNAALLGLFLWLALPDAAPFAWVGVVLYLLLAGWLVGRLHIGRVCMILALTAIIAVLHASGIFGHIPFPPSGL